MKGKSEKGHTRRKNPKSAEAFQEARREENSKKPKQVFNPITKTWVRSA
jgi:hypothetical protein